MIYRFAAACALALELLLGLHVVDLPKVHEAGPLVVAGGAFIAAFILTETWETLRHVVRWLRDSLYRWLRK